MLNKGKDESEQNHFHYDKKKPLKKANKVKVKSYKGLIRSDGVS